MSESIPVSFHIDGPFGLRKSEETFTHDNAIPYLCLAP
jgi:hypothetical protein